MGRHQDSWIPPDRCSRAADCRAEVDIGAGLPRSQKLPNAGLNARDLDLIIVAPSTPDLLPSAANCFRPTGCASGVAFDVTALSGFIFPDVAEQYLKTQACRTIWSFGRSHEPDLDWKDRPPAFSGGRRRRRRSGPRSDGAHLLSTHVHTDAPAAGSAPARRGLQDHPICHESVDRGLHSLKLIEGQFELPGAVRGIIDSIANAPISTASASRISPGSSLTRPTCACSRHRQHPEDSLERFYVTLHKYGNISSASCAISLDEAVRDAA